MICHLSRSLWIQLQSQGVRKNTCETLEFLHTASILLKADSD